MTNEAVKVERTRMTEQEMGPGIVLGGRYELLTQIAKGGMGYVWVARAKGGRGFKRLVAVKTMIASDYEEARLEQMLFQEARFASMIQHPNVVGVEDFGEHEGVCYLAMELVRGETLLGLFKIASTAGGLPLKIAVNIIGQVCRGLHAAHELVGEDGQPLGLVHRDVTPGNVIVTYGGVAKLADFGIAKASAGGALTQAGELKGKMAYLAPEQLLQKPIDRRVDIFAVGITLYSATTGVHPFRHLAGSMGDVMSRIVSDKPPPTPTSITQHYPEALEKVVMKALSKRREDRYSTADELLNGLVAAMPEAFEQGMEREVQQYLESVLSERISETTAQIKAAEEMAEKSFPDISAIRPKHPEAAQSEIQINPMGEIRKMLFWVLGIVFVPIALIAGLVIMLRKPEPVERTEVVPIVPEAKVPAPTSAAPPMEPVPTSAPSVSAAPAVPPAISPTPAPVPRPVIHTQNFKPAPAVEKQPVEETPEVPVTPATVLPSSLPKPAVTQEMSVLPPSNLLPKPVPRAPSGPKSLSSSEGGRRLMINPALPPYRPLIPRALENLGPFTADVRMCVGTTGMPESINMANVNPALAGSFQRALSQWKYRPLLEDVGFCYSFRYEVR
jgi:serine/threonine-protein kinase